MAQRTPKENYLGLGYGIQPDYVPIYTMFGEGPHGETATKSCGPRVFPMDYFGKPEGNDMWGVPYVANAETGFASIPKPGAFILDDITKWSEVVKAPAMPEGIDWELMAQRDYEKANIDRTQSAVMMNAGLMPFEQVMAFMGFNEGLCAFFEEPDYVKELIHYMVDFVLPVIENGIEYYKPDILYILDDTATQSNPFLSVEMYRDILKPAYAKMTKLAMERGIPVQFHNCGRCEDFIDDMIDFGVRFWDPAQTSNDLLGIQEKYKGKIAVCGGWDYNPGRPWRDVPEEEVRQSVRDSLDRFAPGGQYAFCGGALTEFGDEAGRIVNGWVQDEAYNYGRNFYNK